MNELINSQKNMLGISDFLGSASKYTEKNFPNLNLENLFTNAISGKVDTSFINSKILGFARTRGKAYFTANDYSFNSYNYS